MFNIEVKVLQKCWDNIITDKDCYNDVISLQSL